ncbi:MAG: MFS transporter [Acetobacteraceae bacterium]|nr:MFS transporter [Acetobacteraceae bacterium]
MRAEARVALFYAAIFAAPGVTLPFLPVFLEGRGFPADAVGLVMGAAQLARLVATPLGGAVADALGDRRFAAAAFCLAGAVGFAAMLPEGGRAVLAVSVVAASLASGPLFPLADSVALGLAARRGADFGRMRAAGSLSFLLATLLGGLVIERAGAEAVPRLALAGTAAAIASAVALPDLGLARASGLRGVWGLLRLRPFQLLLLVSGLVQGSHALYYAFSAIDWGAAGLSPAVVALLWVEAVAAEILLLTFGRRIVSSFGPIGLLAAGGAGAALRWALTAATADARALALLQPLHAASFAMTMVGAAGLIARSVPPERGATAQALHASLGPGLATALLTPLAGALYAGFGRRSYLAMGLAAGLALAALPALAAALRRTGTAP